MDRNRRVGPGEREPEQAQRTAQQDQQKSWALVLPDKQRQEIGSQQEQGGQIAAALHGYKYVGQQPVVAFLDGYWHSWNMAVVDTKSPHPWHQFRPSIDTMRKQSRRDMVLQWARTYAKEALQIIFKDRPAAELAFVLAGLNAHH
ncbi:hypothetical protein LTR17_016909 [Elasticomyces elasticus]|nr:hypothetical protein LTR17_016909 [Elasticomyces elasticus]